VALARTEESRRAGSIVLACIPVMTPVIFCRLREREMKSR
jgi:hypothetical protein